MSFGCFSLCKTTSSTPMPFLPDLTAFLPTQLAQTLFSNERKKGNIKTVGATTTTAHIHIYTPPFTCPNNNKSETKNYCCERCWPGTVFVSFFLLFSLYLLVSLFANSTSKLLSAKQREEEIQINK